MRFSRKIIYPFLLSLIIALLLTAFNSPRTERYLLSHHTNCEEISWETIYGANDVQKVLCAEADKHQNYPEYAIAVLFNRFTYLNKLVVKSPTQPKFYWANTSHKKAIPFSKTGSNIWEAQPETIELQDKRPPYHSMMHLLGLLLIIFLFTWFFIECRWHIKHSHLTASICALLLITKILSFLLLFPHALNPSDTNGIIWSIGQNFFYLHHMIIFEYFLHSTLEVFSSYQFVVIVHLIFVASCTLYISRFIIQLNVSKYLYLLGIGSLFLPPMMWVYSIFIERSIFVGWLATLFLINLYKIFISKKIIFARLSLFSFLAFLIIIQKQEYLPSILCSYLALVFFKQRKILSALFMITTFALSIYGTNSYYKKYYSTSFSSVVRAPNYHSLLRRIYETCELPIEYLQKLENKFSITTPQNNIADCDHSKTNRDYTNPFADNNIRNFKSLEENIKSVLKDYPLVYLKSRLPVLKSIFNPTSFSLSYWPLISHKDKQRAQYYDLNVIHKGRVNIFTKWLLKYGLLVYLMAPLLVCLFISLLFIGAPSMLIAQITLLHVVVVLALAPVGFPGYLFDLYAIGFLLLPLAVHDLKRTFIFRYFSK